MEKEKITSGKSLGGSLVALGVGGASFFAATKAAQNISFLQSKWWATPVALAVLGHAAKGFSSAGGTAAVGAAGALFAFSYYVNTQSNANPPGAQPPAQAPAQGLRAGDAGALVMGAGEAGALQMGNPTSFTAMRQFRGGYAGRGSPSAYTGAALIERRRPSMAGMLVS
jgi:hypothetical protein